MVHFHPLLGVRGLALQDSAVLSCGEVVNTLAIIREIDRKTTGVDEAHSTCLLLNIGSSVHIVVVRVGLTLELIEFSQFKSFTERPFDNATITRNRDESFFTFFLLDPLNFPNDIGMLVLDFFTGSDGNALTSSYTLLNVVDRDVTVRITDSDHVLLPLGVGTTGDTVLSNDVKLREVGVFESVETE